MDVTTSCLLFAVIVLVVKVDAGTYTYSYEDLCSREGTYKYIEEDSTYYITYYGNVFVKYDDCTVLFQKAGDFHGGELCLTPQTFHLDNCENEFYFEGGDENKEYSCGDIPSEYCVSSEKTLKVTMKNAKMSTSSTDNVRLKVSLKNPDKTYFTVIIVTSVVAVVLFVTIVTVTCICIHCNRGVRTRGNVINPGHTAENDTSTPRTTGPRDEQRHQQIHMSHRRPWIHYPRQPYPRQSYPEPTYQDGRIHRPTHLPPLRQPSGRSGLPVATYVPTYDPPPPYMPPDRY